MDDRHQRLERTIVRSRWIVFLVSRRLSGPSSGATSSTRRTKPLALRGLHIRGKVMRKIILGTVIAALVAASASQAFAGQPRHHVRKDTTISEQVRDARNAIAQPSQPVWPYAGWSAPAGR
jgi:hypothetical protein